MRLSGTMIICMGLSACGSAIAPTTAATVSDAAPFTAPMDPGQISCSSMTNPTALAEATNWVLGHARAASMSRRLAAVPTADDVSQRIARYCSTTPAANIRAASAQLIS